MPRKLLAFLVIFVALGATALVFWKKGSPRAASVNPFKSGESQKINKIMIERAGETITFEKKDGRWRLTAPVADEADPQWTDRLLDTLQNFSVGSILSENKDRYGQFDIEQGKASHLRVFLEGQPNPVLDGYVGKQATGFNDSYFRFEGKPAVHIANGFPNYILVRSSTDYRFKKLLLPNLTDLTSIKITSGKIDVNLSRSSETWTNLKTNAAVDPAWIATLVSRLESLYVSDFGKGDEDAKTLGFDTPFAQISVEKNQAKASAVIGNMVPNADKNAPKKRFAKTEGRAAVLIPPSQPVDDLLTHLKTLK